MTSAEGPAGNEFGATPTCRPVLSDLRNSCDHERLTVVQGSVVTPNNAASFPIVACSSGFTVLAD
jgi:hypothetical protein